MALKTLGFTDEQQGFMARRTYEKLFTPIPNTALPPELLKDLEIVHKALTGDDPFEGASWYLVQSDKGAFKTVLGPAAIANVPSQGLAVIWGQTVIPLTVDSGGGIQDVGKCSFEPVQDDNGIYIRLSIKFGKDTLRVKIRCMFGQDWYDNQMGMVDLENAIGGGNQEAVEKLFRSWQPQPDFEGYWIKPAQLPIGRHQIVASVERETQFGPQHILQVIPDPDTLPFQAEANVKNDEGEYVTTEVTVDGPCVVRGNKAITRALVGAEPFSPENTGTLVINGHGTYNGHATANLAIMFDAEETESYGLGEF